LGSENQERVLLATINLYRLYIRQAEGDPEARDAVRIAKDKLAEIDAATTCNFGVTEADRKRMEAEAKQRAAEAEALSGE
jgi:hypothetical protein